MKGRILQIAQSSSSTYLHVAISLFASLCLATGDSFTNINQKSTVAPTESDPIEFILEIIPIKYANASEIASALDIFRTNGVGRTASLEQMDKRLRSTSQKLKSAQVKFVPDERSNSLL